MPTLTIVAEHVSDRSNPIFRASLRVSPIVNVVPIPTGTTPVPRSIFVAHRLATPYTQLCTALLHLSAPDRGLGVVSPLATITILGRVQRWRTTCCSRTRASWMGPGQPLALGRRRRRRRPDRRGRRGSSPSRPTAPSTSAARSWRPASTTCTPTRTSSCWSSPATRPKVFQGVTFELLGQDGLSYAPVTPEILRADPPPPGRPQRRRSTRRLGLDQRRLVPGSLRADDGRQRRLPRPAQRRPDRRDGLGEAHCHRRPSWTGCAALVREGMEDGAFGLSTGLTYPPILWSDTDEMVAMCEVVAEYGGIYVTHMRGQGDGLLDPIRESIEICQRAGLPLHISHLKSADSAAPPISRASSTCWRAPGPAAWTSRSTATSTTPAAACSTPTCRTGSTRAGRTRSWSGCARPRSATRIRDAVGREDAALGRTDCRLGPHGRESLDGGPDARRADRRRPARTPSTSSATCCWRKTLPSRTSARPATRTRTWARCWRTRTR